MVWLSTVGVRKKLIRSCEVVIRTLGGRVVKYGPLAAASSLVLATSVADIDVTVADG